MHVTHWQFERRGRSLQAIRIQVHIALRWKLPAKLISKNRLQRQSELMTEDGSLSACFVSSNNEFDRNVRIVAVDSLDLFAWAVVGARLRTFVNRIGNVFLCSLFWCSKRTLLHRNETINELFFFFCKFHGQPFHFLFVYVKMKYQIYSYI